MPNRSHSLSIRQPGFLCEASERWERRTYGTMEEHTTNKLPQYRVVYFAVDTPCCVFTYLRYTYAGLC